MASRTVKMCDMPLHVAAQVFETLNPKTVQVIKDKWSGEIVIRTSIAPKYLTYPEGWYYAKGNFRNKHMSSTGFYEEARMENVLGESWYHSADYSTLDD